MFGEELQNSRKDMRSSFVKTATRKPAVLVGRIRERRRNRFEAVGDRASLLQPTTDAGRIASATRLSNGRMSVRLVDRLVLFTRSSAITEGPRNASCQFKSCQLLRNSAETTRTTSPEQIEVIKLEG